MKLLLAHVSPTRKTAKSSPAEALIRDFVERSSRYVPTATLPFASEDALFSAAERQPGRSAAQLILFDSRGENLTSDAFAETIARLRDAGAQQLWFCIGPADGWSAAARARATALMSFGRITLPHELARAVAAEQIYRALTILAGHPYHSGH